MRGINQYPNQYQSEWGIRQQMKICVSLVHANPQECLPLRTFVQVWAHLLLRPRVGPSPRDCHFPPSSESIYLVHHRHHVFTSGRVFFNRYRHVVVPQAAPCLSQHFTVRRHVFINKPVSVDTQRYRSRHMSMFRT